MTSHLLRLDSLIVTTLFDAHAGDDLTRRHYREVLLHTLRKLLPSEFFEEDCHRRRFLLQSAIPLVRCSEIETLPATLSFFSLSRYCVNSFKFFFEMISRWLVPGRRLNVVLVCASDFRLTQLSEEVYTVCEIMIHVTDRAELEEIKRHFPLVQAEIELGIESAFYAQRLLEIKGLTADDKIAHIQQWMACLVKRFPHRYAPDLFTEMQHILVSLKDEFKSARRVRHLSRMIHLHYVLRRQLSAQLQSPSGTWQCGLKLFRSNILKNGKERPIVSLVIAVPFCKEHEILSERHLIQAVQHTIPTALAVEDSFFSHKWGLEGVCVYYLEIEQESRPLASRDITRLSQELGASLQGCLQPRPHHLFLLPNEEEVMRNILTLSKEIKYVCDLPQVLISFDAQTATSLHFTLIIARLLRSDSLPLSSLLDQDTHSSTHYAHDRTKTTGYVRKKYPKEASVFRVTLGKDAFLRHDHSIDLYRARQSIIQDLSHALGEIRDYNGGMISSQYAVLAQIRHLLQEEEGEYDELLMEETFHSLFPVVVRALIDPFAFKTLFSMLRGGLHAHGQMKGEYMAFKETAYNLFVMVISRDASLQERIEAVIRPLHIPSSELAYTSLKRQGKACIGYICCSQDLEKKQALLKAIRATVPNAFAWNKD